MNHSGYDILNWCINLHEIPDSEPLKAEFIEWYKKRKNGEAFLNLHYGVYYGLLDGTIHFWSRPFHCPRLITLNQWSEMFKNNIL